MELRLGDQAPDFVAETTEGAIGFHEWIGESWCVLFSHPEDFTPVCTTELGRVAQLEDEFTKRGCKVIALSVDSLRAHKRWIPDIEETCGVKVNYPLIADSQRKIAQLYGMIDQTSRKHQTARCLYIIAPDKTIKLIITYPASTGRNFDEILRVIDSLQLTSYFNVYTPADWKQGFECIIVPTISDEEAMKKFPKGFNRVKPYLRITPQPNISG